MQWFIRVETLQVCVEEAYTHLYIDTCIDQHILLVYIKLSIIIIHV